MGEFCIVKIAVIIRLLLRQKVVNKKSLNSPRSNTDEETATVVKAAMSIMFDSNLIYQFTSSSKMRKRKGVKFMQIISHDCVIETWDTFLSSFLECQPTSFAQTKCILHLDVLESSFFLYLAICLKWNFLRGFLPIESVPFFQTCVFTVNMSE